MKDSSYHIMLVEDSPSQATKLMAVLEAEGWQVSWAQDAEQAFAQLRSRRPDLILLDYYLPGITGDEVCRRLRMNIDCRGLPIVMLTSEEAHELKGLESGADDFIGKSAESDFLILKLRTLLQKAAPSDRILAGSRDSLRAARILAIDDNNAFLTRLSAELESEGYKVETALNPVKGLELAMHGKFDGVIIDLVMPDMDGIEVCRRLNLERPHLETPLITVVLTGMESRENLSRALEAGADDFVGKSDDFSVLKGRIRALLRRKFYAEENARILREIRERELDAMRERAAKEAAQARASLVEELERKTEELDRSRNQLKHANEAKDRFLAILSHELRTPLTPILAVVSQRYEDPSVPDLLRNDLAMIKRNVELEARLIDDLLDLTRITQGKLEIQSDDVDVEDVLRHVVDAHHPTQSGSPKIAVSYEAGQTHIRGDATRITQVLWNLFRNAIKFTPNDGKITMRLWNPDERHIYFDITDTGAGIERDKLATIFEAFEQGSRQITRQFGGLGLGLTISKAIVDRHDGRISAYSEGLGKGARFRVELPVAASATLGPIMLPECEGEVAVPSIPRESSSRLHILLAEDHVDTREVMEQLLKLRGYKVTSVSGVKAAAQVAKSGQRIDIFISDVGLEDGSGFDALREVTKHHKVPAIALSGYGMEEDIRKSREAGFISHLVKPVDFDKLESAIEALAVASPVEDRPASILLVEDDPDTAQAIADILRGSGWQVDTAHTIAQGMEKMLHGKFDLLVCDIGLPDGHGISLLTTIRQFSQAPALALTAYGSQDDIDRCLKAGFARHLTKPVDRDTLTRAVSELLAD